MDGEVWPPVEIPVDHRSDDVPAGWYDDDSTGPDGLLDHADFRFETASGELTVLVHKFAYRPGSFRLRCEDHGEASDAPVKDFVIRNWSSLSSPNPGPDAASSPTRLAPAPSPRAADASSQP